MDHEPRLVETFVALADTLTADFDVVELMQTLVEESVNLLAAEAAGLMLADGHGALQVMASSSELSLHLENFQLEHGEGPCLDCFRSGTQVLVPDLAAEADRWPAFVAEAGARGFGAVHALPLRLRSETIGAVNLFHAEPGPLSEGDLRVGQALASVATIGILQERALQRSETLSEQLQKALDSRVVIEQAKGVLAQRGELDMDTAFARLRRYCRSNNLRLSEVARSVVEGTIDPRIVL